jgi:hypothetical protein
MICYNKTRNRRNLERKARKVFSLKVFVNQSKQQQKRSTIVFKIENKAATTLLLLRAFPNGLKGN